MQWQLPLLSVSILRQCKTQSPLWSLSSLTARHALWSWLFCTTPTLYKKPNIKYVQSLGTEGFGNILCINVVIPHLLLSVLTFFPVHRGSPNMIKNYCHTEFKGSENSLRHSYRQGAWSNRTPWDNQGFHAPTRSMHETNVLAPHQSSTEICQLRTYLVPLSVCCSALFVPPNVKAR